MGRFKKLSLNNTTKYFIALFIVLISACEKDSSSNGCLCTITLNGNTWSQYNVTNCSTCNAPAGYSANCDCN